MGNIIRCSVCIFRRLNEFIIESVDSLSLTSQLKVRHVAP